MCHNTMLLGLGAIHALDYVIVWKCSVLSTQAKRGDALSTIYIVKLSRFVSHLMSLNLTEVGKLNSSYQFPSLGFQD